MILFISLWLIIIAVCVVIGATILQWVGAGQFDRIGDRFVISVWLGVAALCVLLLAASLALPLSPLVGASVAGAFVLVSLSHRGTRNEIKALRAALSPRLFLGALALIVGVAAYTTQNVTWYDTGLYHVGVIKWLSQFGAPPGLALIHIRFGIASSWFAAAAPLDAGRLEGRTATLLGGLVLLLAVFHFLLCASRCLTNRARLADWFVVSASLLLIPVALYWGAFVSPSPDVPVMILTVVVAWTIVVISDSPHSETRNRFIREASIIPFILSAVAITIKLNALALVIVAAFFYLFHSRFNFRSILSLGAVGLALIAPMIGYQVITSGCPLFPTSLMCFDLPWAVEPERARNYTDIVMTWARWDGPPPPFASAFNWLWRGWITAGTTPKSLLLILISMVIAAVGLAITRFGGRLKFGRWLMMLGIAGLAFLLMTRANNLLILCVLLLALVTYRRQFVGKSWLMAIGLLGTVLIMYGAPSLRFGAGYIAVLWACFAVTYSETIRRSMRSITLSFQARESSQMVLSTLLVAAGLTVGLCRVILRDQTPRGTATIRAEEKGFPLLMPPRIDSAVVAHRRVNDIDYYRPVEGDQCWAAELPCAPTDLPEDIMLREPTRGIAAGFRHGSHFAPQTPPSNSR